MGFETELYLASQLEVEGTKSDLVLSICKELSATEYISGLGSKDYLVKHNPFENSPIELSYIHYDQPQYQQVYTGFVPYLSALDLLMNEGDSSLEIIRSGYK